MAQIDLKNATMYIRDGYAGPGGDGIAAINNVAGYPANATVLIINGMTGNLAVNDYVTIAGSLSAGELIKHRITAVSGTPTTGITVTPGLGASVVDTAVVTVMPHQLEIRIGEGNMQWTEKKPREYVRDRGRLDTVKDADEEPLEASFDIMWEFIKGDTDKPPTIEDALKQRGNAAGWVSTSLDPCHPYCVDIYIEHDTPCTGDEDEVVVLKYFRQEELNHDLRGATIACSGKCNITQAEVTRV